MRWRWAFPIALAPWALALLVLGLGLSGTVAGPEDNLERPGTPENVQAWTGSGRCAGRGCHGNVDVAGTLGTEYNTWINLDKHAGAFQVLSNKVSTAIQDRLGVEILATEDALCLSCHGHPAPEVASHSSNDLLDFQPIGIGCESCHGPAGNWLDNHYRQDWKELSEAQKAEQGLRNLSTATQRARVCADCHVGENLDQQVNHDLIAAGHPRLNFEFSSYQARMPRHWAKSDKEPSEAQAWAVGQAVTLQATLRLLQDRANGAARTDPQQPWPEFSEYSCFACHHDLRDTGIRYTDVEAGQQPGSLPWNTWGLPMARTLAEHEGQALWLEQLDSIEQQMQLPYPDPEAVAALAGEAADELDTWIKALDDPANPFSQQDLLEFLASIERDSEHDKFQRLTAHWDAAAQLYLALRALERAEIAELLLQGTLPGEREREIHDRLGKMVKYLRFPEGQNSPGMSAEPIVGPDARTREGAVRMVQEILERIRPPASD